MIPTPAKRPSSILLLLAAIILTVTACAPALYQAENLQQKPFNQLDLAGNACGPAALLNSYRFGNPSWKKLSEEPPGLTDRERIRSIARGPAMRESSSLPGRARWSRNGINLLDLRDVANEISTPHGFPQLSQQTLFLKPADTQQSLLRHTHSYLTTSLSKGMPPILSVRQFAKRGSRWVAIQGHFVTITSVPGKISQGETFFPITYIDPLGGHHRQGHIRISQTAFLTTDPSRTPNLQADFPTATFGKKSIRPGEQTIIAASAILGHF
ncbi:MAG: hypothetical protein ACSHX7_09850 [Luteolibacter sp.]